MSGVLSMYRNDYKAIIKGTYPFDLLLDEEQETIMEDAQLLNFKENQFIFHEEDEEVEIYFLIKGIAKNVLHQQNGQQFSVRYYYSGDLIGTLILLAGDHLNFSVQALDDCYTVLFKKSSFLNIMKTNREFSTAILEEIGERMKTLYDNLKKERSQKEDENIPLYRTRVHSIMDKAPKITEKLTVNEVATLLIDLKMMALIVTDHHDSLRGVITNQQIIQALLGHAGEDKVTEWMVKNPNWIQEDAFSYEALTYFKDDHVDMVPVLNKDKVVGALTAESFLRLQESKFISLSENLEKADDIYELAKLSPKINKDFLEFTKALLVEKTAPTEVCELISNYNDSLHRKIIKFAIRDMNREGYGQPPVNYCFIVMGSQGRKEQAFSTDQDNGLILDNYEHLANKDKVESYFQRFAEKINEGLALCGFPKCTGGIMAMEKKWRRSMSSWRNEIKRWTRETYPQEVRDFTIFVDYRPVYGDFKLAHQLRDDMTPVIEKAKILQAMMMKDTIFFRVPINVFGRISSEGKRQRLNLKKSAIMQIVNGIRIYAIRNGIKETNTKKRLAELKKMKIFNSSEVDRMITALDYLYDLRIKHNMKQIEENEPLSNLVYLTKLEKEDKNKLKEALIIARKIQQMSEVSFPRNWGL